ncbi:MULTISPECIES: TRAP transporter small permease subunit [Marinobacter]|uniref:TRAP transporter small permease protein n=1 Tax=Marinobacter salsuginis TaxID=418719 RepID=A0A5M3PPM3_9GAMM|nr:MULTISPECIES: TRAP transporter small permease subunit [Marinobacter]GBO84873.1 transporter DctQ-related protein [Marinobacter salsuginis]
MMNVSSYLGKAVDALSKAAALIGALLIVPLIGSLTYEVVSRYILNTPTVWAYEMSYMLMGSIFLLGMAYALKVREHVNVDIFYGILPPRGKATMDMIGLAVLLVALIWIVDALFQYALEAYEYQETSGASGWNPLIWPFRTVWVIGFGILTAQTAVELARSIAILFKGEGESGVWHE